MVLCSRVLDEIHQVHVDFDGLICFLERERKQKSYLTMKMEEKRHF